ncbi:Uncharacterised protein [Mycobacteroides abscessus subsp. abscessus]|nr:Uncharacterised protein [Mycobacteroides abscessus subsp. abscessus]
MVSHAASPSMMSLEKSSLNRSRTTLTSTSGSSYSATAAPDALEVRSVALCSMPCHCSCNRCTSARMSSSRTPSEAVRMMTPASAGTMSRRISLRR